LQLSQFSVGWGTLVAVKVICPTTCVEFLDDDMVAGIGSSAQARKGPGNIAWFEAIIEHEHRFKDASQHRDRKTAQEFACVPTDVGAAHLSAV
jgi:hypothetical protein